MSEHIKQDADLSGLPQAGTDVVSLILKMQQQLNFLEKKIDLLIGQSPERSSGERRFSKPFRPSFGHGGHSHGKRDFNRGPRERSFPHERPRESGFSHDRPKEGSFGQGRPFDRKPGAGPRGFGHGEKPFFRHRKGPRPHRESH